MLKLMNWLFDWAANSWGRCAQFLPLSPLVLRIRITNRCNLSCHYCYVGESLNRPKQNILELHEWQQILKDVPRSTLVDITGGEPLLAPHFPQLLDLLLSRNMQVSLITNGTVFKEEVFRLIVQKKLKHLMISLDGHEEIHDSIRGKGSFLKALKTVEFIYKLKVENNTSYPKLVAKVTVTPQNAHQLESFCQDLVLNKHFDGVTLNLLFQNKARDGFVDEDNLEAFKFHEGNKSVLNPEEAHLLSNKIRAAKKTLQDKIQVRPEIDLANLPLYFTNPSLLRPKNCFKFNSVVTLYHDGALTPCDLGLDVGNIREINYQVSKIFGMQKMKSFLDLMRRLKSQNLPGCEGCCLKKHERVL